jgi:hypothetical protein
LSSEPKQARSNSSSSTSPSAQRTQLLRARLLEAIDESTIDAVVETLAEHAVEGNLPAIKLLLEYAAGRPAPSREVLVSDRESPGLDWEQFLAPILAALSIHPQAKIDLAAALDSLPRDEAARAAREGP